MCVTRKSPLSSKGKSNSVDTSSERAERSPAPGKLLPIQKWELPRTVTELRGFLGLTNYFSEYVHHYAEVAAPLMAKLRLNRQDGKKGSRLRLLWTEGEVEAFHKLKARLCEQMELWQINLDQPFQLHCDASDHAIGAELRQEIQGQWRPVALFSRKLGKSQKQLGGTREGDVRHSGGTPKMGWSDWLPARGNTHRPPGTPVLGHRTCGHPLRTKGKACPLARDPVTI